MKCGELQKLSCTEFKVHKAAKLSESSKSKKAVGFSDLIFFPNTDGGRCMWKATFN